jgi:hypothetical protein
MDNRPMAVGAHRASPAVDAELTQRRLDLELALIDSAIRMVETGNSRRVDVAGLRFVDILIDCLAPAARSRGLIVEPEWSIGEVPTAITVRARD